MFKRKLEALGYPLWESFEYEDAYSVSLRTLVVWLEDQKIRHYPIEGREALRDTDSMDWPTHFTKYLIDLGVPCFDSNNLPPCVEWLIGFAVRLEYTDNADEYSKAASKYGTSYISEPAKTPATSNSNSSKPLDHINFNSPETVAGINAIAAKLGITQHPNSAKTLEAIAHLTKARFTKDIVDNPEKFQPKGTPFPLLEFEMGFTDGDEVKKQAAKILRILYIEDLRELQTKINESIVAVQTITADPQVETKLLRAGQFLAGMQKKY